MTSRLAICATALVLLSVASAAAEPATVTSAVNLRSGAGTDNAVVGRIPAGALVEASNCGEWCEIEWQGKKGFAIATSLDRSGRVPARRAKAQRDPYATDAPKGDVPMSAGTYQAPERRTGPYFWSYGPPSGPFKGTSGIGYRGTW
jgi:uncharacterized protein YraI